jgi:lipopolysaccharide biosynthesis glycosyltransferase
MTTVAFFADRNVIAPAHVAVASICANWQGPEALDVRLFHAGWTTSDIERLHATARMNTQRAVLRVEELPLERFAAWTALYGTRMPYGRLLLPRLLAQESAVLYLDVDVIVEMDIRELIRACPPDMLASALPGWDFAHSHDASLAAHLGVSAHEAYFHSGLLLLDLHRCRAERIADKFLEFGDRHRARLNSHDQTVINFVLRDRIAPMPTELTTHLYPTSAPTQRRVGVVHSFCGSPKPFDPAGNWLNNHHAYFDEWLARTALAGWSPNSLHELARMKNIRLLRPVAGTVLKRLAALGRGRV